MKVSPFIVENHELVGFLLIPLLLPNSVVFEDFQHKFAQRFGVNPFAETVWMDMPLRHLWVGLTLIIVLNHYAVEE